MILRNTLLFISLALVTISCGTLKETGSTPHDGPIVQTTFLGAKFGDSPTRVSQRFYRLHPIRKADGSYTILDQSFAGHSWHFVQFIFVEKMLYIVNFQQEHLHKSAADERMNAICQMLHTKYGEMKPTTDGDGFIFTDAEQNSVSIRVHLGTSSTGKEFWYCDLTYYWGAGSLLTYMKSITEI